MPHSRGQNVLGSLAVLVKPGAERSALAGQGRSGLSQSAGDLLAQRGRDGLSHMAGLVGEP